MSEVKGFNAAAEGSGQQHVLAGQVLQCFEGQHCGEVVVVDTDGHVELKDRKTGEIARVPVDTEIMRPVRLSEPGCEG